MSIPRQVEEAATLAEELHGRMFQANPDPNEVQDEGQQEEVQAAEEVTVEETAPPTNDKKEDEETYKARYYSLKGMYDADVPRLHKELKELKTRVFERLGDVSAPVEQQVPTNPDIEELARYREEYGEDLIKMARLVARAELEPLVKQKIDPMQQQVEDVSETQIRVAKQNFQQYLDKAVDGDWRSFWLQENPKFDAFLDSTDPYGLYTYREIADKYNTDWNADGLANLFNLYLKQQGQTAPPAQEVEPPKRTAAPNPAQQALVAPSRSTQNTPPATQDKRIWTNEIMKEFERNERAGKYTQEEADAIWADLLSAPKENRFRH